MRRILKIVFVLIAIIFLALFIIIKQRISSNKVVVNENRMINREKKFKVFNFDSAKYVISDIFSYDDNWNSDKYPISEHFKEKYKTKYDINDDFTKKNTFNARLDYANDKEIRVVIDCGLKDLSISKNLVKYYYDCIVDKNCELYDLEYKYKVPYKYTLDEYWGERYERADGKFDTKEYNVYELLAYIANKYVNDNFAWNPYEELEFSEEKMPYADDCKIINRPNLDELGIPNASYWYDSDLNGDYNEEDIYSKDGFKYLIFEYDDHKIKYEVRYHVNDEYFFDYIEFVEVEN